MTNDKWIQFPKNPYEGQIFYYPATKDTFTYIIPKGHPNDGQVFYYPPTEDTFTYIAPSKKTGEGQWLMITHQDFSKPY